MQVVASIEYEKLQQIGFGHGMNSEVFIAFDPQLNGEIAVKEIEKTRLGNNLVSYFDGADNVRNFAPERRPGSIRLRDAGQNLPRHAALPEGVVG